jgi:hypothetical protein
LTAIKLRKFIDISKSKDEKLEAELKKLQMNKSILIIAKNPPLCTSFATASPTNIVHTFEDEAFAGSRFLW